MESSSSIHHFGASVGEALEGFARLGAEIERLCEAAIHIKLSAVLIDHFVIHEEMRREPLQLEVALLADRALFLPEIPDQNIEQMFLRHLADPVTLKNPSAYSGIGMQLRRSLGGRLFTSARIFSFSMPGTSHWQRLSST